MWLTRKKKKKRKVPPKTYILLLSELRGWEFKPPIQTSESHMIFVGLLEKGQPYSVKTKMDRKSLNTYGACCLIVKAPQKTVIKTLQRRLGRAACRLFRWSWWRHRHRPPQRTQSPSGAWAAASDWSWMPRPRPWWWCRCWHSQTPGAGSLCCPLGPGLGGGGGGGGKRIRTGISNHVKSNLL